MADAENLDKTAYIVAVVLYGRLDFIFVVELV